MYVARWPDGDANAAKKKQPIFRLRKTNGCKTASPPYTSATAFVTPPTTTAARSGYTERPAKPSGPQG